MRYKANNVKCWQQSDNKCQIGGKEFTENIVKTLISITYDIIFLAQKLQYFRSPIKNTYW
jgi:hypothetical protein